MNDSATTPLIDAVGITRRAADGAVLLDQITFSVSAGERWSITGDSGAGKTLLMRSLAALDPFSGELRWQGTALTHADIPEYRSHVIYLAQSATLIPGTVEENLRLPFSLKRHAGRNFDRDAVQAQLKSLGKLDSFMIRRDSELSGGEKQIVALLRALQLSPSVLLLDESTSALDPGSELAAERLVNQWLQASPATRAVVWVSHDEAQRRRVSDKSFRLEFGRHVEETT